MKRPFEDLIETISENLVKMNENENKNLEFIQQYLVWMIGFSTGALYLLISNVVNFKGIFSYGVIKAIIIFLSISVVCGIISRFAFILYQAEVNNSLFFLKESFSNKKRIPDTFEDISTETDAKKIVDLLKYYFDEDLTFAFDLYNNSDERGQIILLESFKKTYQNLTEWAKRDYELALAFIDDTMKKAYRYSDKEIKRIKTHSYIRLFRSASFNLLFLSGLSFIVSLLIMVSAY